MACIIDIRHWLDEDGNPVPELRRRVLRLARLIEYGGPLVRGAARATLVECQRRPRGQACPGLLWVVKTEDDLIKTWCPNCDTQEISIPGWEETEWADGPCLPVLPVERVWN